MGNVKRKRTVSFCSHCQCVYKKQR
uniref:Uncharacterized protein n=1 Tax=Anguilla anguilla TaxID=7936 RepID=A0A0E9W403_ANGAN